MITLRLHDRRRDTFQTLTPGLLRLDGLDGFELEWFSDAGEEPRVLVGGSAAESPATLVADKQGECVIRVLDNGRMASFCIQIPPESIPDAALRSALHQFGAQADGATPSPGMSAEELLAYPFFSSQTILATLDDVAAEAFEELLQAALPSLSRICAKPRRALQVERQVMQLDRVRRIPHDAFEHLTAHPELWQSRSAVQIKPQKLLTEVPEETLDLYENRFVVTLIKRLMRYLQERCRQAERAFFQTEAFKAHSFEGYQYNRFRESRMQELWTRHGAFMDNDRHADAEDLLRKLLNLSAGVSACLDSGLSRSLYRKPPVRSPLKSTNILNMDKDYCLLKELWDALDRLEQSGDSGQQSSRVRCGDLLEDYAVYVYGCVLLSLRWAGFQPAPGGTGSRKLAREGWEVMVHPPASGSGVIELDMAWKAPRKLPHQVVRTHPSAVQLTIVPLARMLWGEGREIGAQLDRLQDLGTQLLGWGEGPRWKAVKGPLHSLLFVHPTDLRDRRQIDEEAEPALIRRMLSLGEHFNLPEDYRRQVRRDNGATERVGMMPVSPLDLNSLERIQRFLRFHTLGSDLIAGVHPSVCPVCDADLSALDFGDSDAGECPRCQAKWSWRTCDNCKGRVPQLEPLRRKAGEDGEKHPRYAVRAMALEYLLGRDQLAGLCESTELAQSGRLRMICPHCGACPGKGETRARCERCRCAGFGQG